MKRLLLSFFFAGAMSLFSLGGFSDDSGDASIKAAIAAVQKVLPPGDKIEIVENANEYMRTLAKRPDIEDSFHVVDLSRLQNRIGLWKKHLQPVTPFYAVKTNNDKAVVAMMAQLGSGFDCASKGELEQALALGVSPDNIIFAHPRKPDAAMRYAIEKGVKKAVLDCPEEFDRMDKISQDWEYVIRIKTHDEHSAAGFSKKFGASIDEAKKLIDYAFSQKHKVTVAGVSFHVGSNSRDDSSYASALDDAAAIFKYASEKWNRELYLVDVGGGWVGDDDAYFAKQANAVIETYKKNFKPNVRIIAEPGRFFATETTSIAMKIIGKRQIDNDGKRTFEYFLTNGAYGMFLTSLAYEYDLKKLEAEGWHFKPLFQPENPDVSYETKLWGPTCDSYDYIAGNVKLPELQSGDFIYTATAGAYTYSTQTNFNNIPPSKAYYVYEMKLQPK